MMSTTLHRNRDAVKMSKYETLIKKWNVLFFLKGHYVVGYLLHSNERKWDFLDVA